MSVSPKNLAWIMLIIGLLFGVAFLIVALDTAGPHLSRGAPINNNGWMALISTGLGFFGLSGASLLTAILSRFHIALPGGEQTAEQAVEQVVELSASFSALMANKTNFAAQRRFVFALADAAMILKGCKVSHEDGVLRIEYSGFVEPTPPGPPAPVPGPAAPSVPS